MEPALCLSLTIALAAVLGLRDDLPKAETLLDQWEAKGHDLLARAALQSLVMKGAMVVPGLAQKASFEEVYLGTSQVKYTTSWPVMGRQTQGTTGALSWTTDPAFGVAIKEGDAQASVQRMYAISRRAPWRTLYERAATSRKIEVDGRPHFELLMTPKVGAADRWFLDCESLLLSCVDLSLPDPAGGGELACRFAYADWQPVSGILFPRVKKQIVAGMEIVFSYDSIIVNGEVSAERVAPPAEVEAAIHDPKQRTPTATAPGECQLDSVKAQPTATIRMTVKAAEISKSLAVMLPEVGAYLHKVGAVPAGPPFSRYHRIDGDSIDLEAGIAVQSPIKGEGRVQPSELPAGKVAVTWHVGPYQLLPQSHAVLEQWMRARSLQAAGGFWEIYWTDPGLELDQSKWKTQIVWPVR